MLWTDVTGPLRQPHRPDDPSDRRIRRSWLLFAGSFLGIGAVMLLRLVDQPRPADFVLLIGLVVLGYAAVVHWTALRDIEVGRRGEAESFARILSGLSRSISPDAIVSAIVEELGTATRADHVVVVRRRPDAGVLEATLVSSRPGVPSSMTLFPLSDLVDPAREPFGREPFRIDRRRMHGRTGDGATSLRESVAVPVVGDRAALPIGIGARIGGWPALPLGVGTSIAAALDPRPRTVDRWASAPDPEPAAGVESVRRRAAASGGGPTLDGEPAQGRESVPGPDGVAADRPMPGSFDVPPSAGRIADRVAARARSAYGLKHTLAGPLQVDGETVGAIVISRRTGDEWPDAAQRLLAAAAAEASAALARAYSHRQAETLASTDALTNLPNRRYFDEFCGLLARRRRSDDAAGVLMIDIDHFKALNDRYGHGVGDEVLREVAGAIADAVREADVPARYGGEEFAVLLRNPSPDVAIEVGERVRAAVAALDLREMGVPGVSVSVGVAVAERPDEPIADLVARADAALYRAKRAGRDRVMAA